jgi:hypothetical protein
MSEQLRTPEQGIPNTSNANVLYLVAFSCMAVILLITSCFTCTRARLYLASLLCCCHFREFQYERRRLQNAEEDARRDRVPVFYNTSPMNSRSYDIVGSLPDVTYKGRPEGTADEDDVCVVCCEQYQAGDVLKLLPCVHKYHKACITAWLLRQDRCPICQRSVLPGQGVPDEALASLDAPAVAAGVTTAHVTISVAGSGAPQEVAAGQQEAAPPPQQQQPGSFQRQLAVQGG